MRVTIWGKMDYIYTSIVSEAETAESRLIKTINKHPGRE